MTVATKQKSKHTTVHRKRIGEHQRRSTHFMKAYWPYIPMAFIVGVSMLFNSLMLQPHVLSYATNTSQAGLLAGTNAERANNGLSQLTINNQLTLAAQTKAQDMVARNYWSHNTPDGQEPWVFISNAGYQYLAAGENLAYGFTTSDDTITGWMNSPGHRANILNTSYQEVGFGIANSADFQSNGEETIVVAMYGKPASTAVAAPAPATTTPSTQTNTPQTTAPDDSVADQQPIAVEKTKNADGSEGVSVSATVPDGAGEKVARIQLATSGAAPWSVLVASSLAVGLLIWLIGRHSLAWHRFLRKGEQFALKHRFLDMILISFIMIAAILSQTSGFIK